MTSDPIRAAIEQLRASVEALPKDIAADTDQGIDGRWEVVGSGKSSVGVPIRDGGSSWMHIADCEDEYDDQGQALARHIALAASPHVTEALAELLDTIAMHAARNHGEGYDCDGVCVDNIVQDAEALAEAITHRSTA